MARSTEGASMSAPAERNFRSEISSERATYRAGYEAGLIDGYRRVWQTPVLAEIVDELVLLREAAERLGAKCDYWMARADRMELEATYWHGVAGDEGAFCNRLQNRAVSP